VTEGLRLYSAYRTNDPTTLIWVCCSLSIAFRNVGPWISGAMFGRISRTVLNPALEPSRY